MNLFQNLKKALAKNQKPNPFNNRIIAHAVLAMVCIVLTIVLIFPMAAAWYSNVVEVGSMQFQADPWGFSGTVKLDSALFQAAPGDSGIVTLSVENPSDDVIAMTVGANKATMPVEMRQRIYFYVESPKQINGEVVQRTYLNTNAGFDYTIMPGRTVTMSPDYSNVAPVRWMWVYDMLGYYVQGKWSETGSFVASEYLRPVEYNFDRASFDPDTGLLAAVDCTEISPEGTPVADFVSQLTQTDGYAGTAVADENHPGWYQVSVNEKGEGVWLYLCSKADILAANAYDTKLGDEAYQLAEGQEAQLFTAQLLVTGQRKELISETVDNAQQLQDALVSGNSDRIILNQGLTLEQTVTVQSNKELILDLQGNTLALNGPSSGMILEEGSSLTLTNGTLEGISTNYAIEAIGADVKLDGVTVQNTKRAIAINDHKASLYGDSQVYITDCNLSAGECGVIIQGNGDDSSAKTVLVIEDSVIQGDYYGISGNGTRYGTDVTIKNSTVSGYWTAVYHPQRDSSMTIINCDMSGLTGLIAKGGVVNIESSRITGTMETAYDTTGYPSGDGSLDTGDAVYIECNYTFTTVTVHISGDCELNSVANYAIRKYMEDAENGTFVITGGTFTGNRDCTLSQYVPQGYTVTGDGSKEVTVTADGT